jgi:hypothetical protein
MNTFKCLLLTAVAAFALTACEPASNTAVNSNAKPANVANSNANSTAAAAPTKESLMALETKANEAWKNKDLKFWDTFLSSRMIGYSKDGKFGKADLAKMMENEKCEVKSYALSEEQMTQLGPDAAMVTYKNAQDATCNGQKVPANVWVATIYVREGGEWKALWHGEAPMPDPNAKPAAAAPAKPADTAAKASPAANSSPATTTAPDAATEAMFSLEKKAWDAWKAKDAKGLEDWSSANMVSFTDKGRENRADAIKTWTTDGCEVKTINLTDPTTVSLGPDHSLLLFRAAVDGRCNGQQIPALIGSSVYVKEGGTWKALFTMNSPSM